MVTVLQTSLTACSHVCGCVSCVLIHEINKDTFLLSSGVWRTLGSKLSQKKTLTELMLTISIFEILKLKKCVGQNILTRHA